MPALRHILRALLFALLFPALLVPSGLGMSVCFCAEMSSPRHAAIDVTSCCARPAAANDGETCARIGRNAQHSCEHCRHFQVDDREPSTPSKSSVESPLAFVPPAVLSVVLSTPRPAPFARRVFDANDLAPPGCTRNLLLRL